MPDLNNTILSQNNYRTQPTTKFGTRQMQRISIYTNADTKTNYLDSNSLYSQIVRSLQQNVELYAVHMPDTAFFTCWGEYCFQIDVAYDTAVDYWNDANSFIDDGDPVNWYYGIAEGNPNMNGLYDVVTNALSKAQVDTYCFPMITWTNGDMTWPSNNTTVSGGLTPELRKNTADQALAPGDSDFTRKRKISDWIKTLNK